MQRKVEQLHPLLGKYERFLVKGGLKDGAVGYVKPMLVEMGICSFVNPPFINFTFELTSMGRTVTYSFNDVITCLVLLRLYLVLRMLSHYSPFSSDHSSAWSSLFCQSDSTSFGLKCLLHAYPKATVSIVVVALTALFAEGIRVWER